MQKAILCPGFPGCFLTGAIHTLDEAANVDLMQITFDFNRDFAY